MFIRSLSATSLAITLLFIAVASTVTHAASSPSRSTGSSNFGKSNTKDTASPAVAGEQGANTVIFENYQKCYATLISDYAGSPEEEITARKVSLKKFCRAVSQAKNQKKFYDCYNSNLKSGNELDAIIAECSANNEKPDR